MLGKPGQRAREAVGGVLRPVGRTVVGMERMAGFWIYVESAGARHCVAGRRVSGAAGTAAVKRNLGSRQTVSMSVEPAGATMAHGLAGSRGLQIQIPAKVLSLS